jgi:phasin family protein
MIKTPEDLLKLQAEAYSAHQAAVAKTLEGFEKLASLNLRAAGESLALHNEQLKALVGARDPQSAAQVLTDMAKPSTEALTVWAREFYQLSSQTATELVGLAEKQMADGQKQLATAVELLAKNAPAGSESAVQMLRTSMNAASSACEQAIKAGRQVADQVQAAVSPATKPAGRKAA